jgi:outer membrane immunogenic protein
MKTTLNTIYKLAITISTLAYAIGGSAADYTQRLEGLGGNKSLIKKARSLDPNNKVRIVQNRSVDRNWRLELGVNYGMNAGGDPYITTQNLGGSLDLHINPKWSVGMRYISHYNELTAEGKRVFDEAKNQEAIDGRFRKTAVEYPLESTLGVINFYPIYGKMNMFDFGVAQFDMYLLAGAGTVQLESSGAVPSWTAGGGVGLWLSQHFTSRLEVRYQNYQDELYTGKRDLDLVVTTFSIGLLL